MCSCRMNTCGGGYVLFFFSFLSGQTVNHCQIPNLPFFWMTILWKLQPPFHMRHSRICWRRQWHPTPVLLPGKSHGWRNLVGCSPWGRYESDTIEQIHFHFSLSRIGEGNGNPLQCSCLENPRDGEPSGLPSMALHRVGHDWSDLAAARYALLMGVCNGTITLENSLTFSYKVKCISTIWLSNFIPIHLTRRKQQILGLNQEYS